MSCSNLRGSSDCVCGGWKLCAETGPAWHTSYQPNPVTFKYKDPSSSKQPSRPPRQTFPAPSIALHAQAAQCPPPACRPFPVLNISDFLRFSFQSTESFVSRIHFQMSSWVMFNLSRLDTLRHTACHNDIGSSSIKNNHVLSQDPKHV